MKNTKVRKASENKTRKKMLDTVGAPPVKPEGAGILTTYDELREKARKFAEGKYNLLVIAGGPGLSKSTTFKQALEAVVGNDYCFIEANASPFGAYCKLWRKRNKLAVFDDADPINEQPGGKRLLKQVGQTDQWKHCSWESKATMGKKALAPQEFWTSSKVCIITNSWEYRQGNVHTAAVEDRGQCWLFMPTAHGNPPFCERVVLVSGRIRFYCPAPTLPSPSFRAALHQNVGNEEGGRRLAVICPRSDFRGRRLRANCPKPDAQHVFVQHEAA